MRFLLFGCIMITTMLMAEAVRPPGFSGGNNRPQPQPQPMAPPQLSKPAVYPPGVQPVQIFPLEQVTEEMWDRFLQGKLGDVAIECSKGSELPLFFKFNTTLFSLANEPKEEMRLKIERTFYVRYPGADFLFSLDTVEWWGFPLFFKGSLNADFSILKNGPEICLEFDLVK